VVDKAPKRRYKTPNPSLYRKTVGMPVAATATERLWFLNHLVTVRVPHEGGADGISVLESFAPHGDSPPLHVHQSEDEIFHVLEGELRLRAGDADVWVGAGEAILAPKRVPHTYRVESPAGARWLVITARGDFEHFVRALGRRAERPELPAPHGPPTPEQADALAAAAREHGIELVGPPLES
jgi:mannose-6-phosphate isomerase-like protein (cupin superfamily)